MPRIDLALIVCSEGGRPGMRAGRLRRREQRLGVTPSWRRTGHVTQGTIEREAGHIPQAMKGVFMDQWEVSDERHRYTDEDFTQEHIICH
jgi:hypothetical protein